jgi:hypothetical protein
VRWPDEVVVREYDGYTVFLHLPTGAFYQIDTSGAAIAAEELLARAELIGHVRDLTDGSPFREGGAEHLIAVESDSCMSPPENYRL